MARRLVSKYSSILRRRPRSTHSQLLHDANARQQRCEKSLGVSGTKFKPQELNVNPNSAPAQIARAPNRGKIRNSHESRLLQVPLFSSFFFICDYIHCGVCLPLQIFNLSFPPLLYSSSSPILRDTLSEGCSDEDPIASPELWPPL